MLDLKTLEILLAIKEYKSFSKAAVFLKKNISNISRSVKNAEAQMKIKFFIRTTRELKVSDEAIDFLAKAEQSLDILKTATNDLTNNSLSLNSKLKIDAASPFILHQIVDKISIFKKEYPNIKLEISSFDNIVSLIENKIDIAIRVGKVDVSNLYFKTLGHSKMHLVASPDYLASNSSAKNIKQLKQHKLLGFIEPTNLNTWHLSESIKIKPNISVSSGEALRRLALNSQGIAFLSNFMIKKDLKNKTLVSILPNMIKTPNAREPITALYTTKIKYSKKIEVFLEFLQKHLDL